LFLALTLVAAGCGRFGFGPAADGDGGGGAGDGDGAGDAAPDAVSTGAVGPRWMRQFGVSTLPSGHGGGANGGGEVAVVQQFTGSYSIDGVALSGQGFISTAFLRYDATGNVQRAVTLDSDGFCDMRDAIIDGPDTIVSGLTIGTTVTPAYGACSIATNREDPVAIRIAGDGTQSVVAHFLAGGANAQGWRVAPLSDGSLVMAGIYASALTVATALPTAMTDPSTWIGRSNPSMPTIGAWSWGLTNTVEIHAGPLAVRDDGTCAMGAFRGPTTLFGMAVSYVGGYDTWVAHLSSTGTVDFVRGVGSTADEPSFDNNNSIVALPGGGCALGIAANADVTYDAMTFPVSQGNGLLLELGGNGALVHGARYPGPPALAMIGDRLFVAFSVTAPYTVGTQIHTPVGSDVLIIERGTSAPDRLLGVVGGTGDQFAFDLFEAAPDALGLVVQSSGPLSFGAASFDSGATLVRAVGVLGI
jgi:hypothetical protein